MEAKREGIRRLPYVSSDTQSILIKYNSLLKRDTESEPNAKALASTIDSMALSCSLAYGHFLCTPTRQIKLWHLLVPLNWDHTICSFTRIWDLLRHNATVNSLTRLSVNISPPFQTLNLFLSMPAQISWGTTSWPPTSPKRWPHPFIWNKSCSSLKPL